MHLAIESLSHRLHRQVVAVVVEGFLPNDVGEPLVQFNRNLMEWRGSVPAPLSASRGRCSSCMSRFCVSSGSVLFSKKKKENYRVPTQRKVERIGRNVC